MTNPLKSIVDICIGKTKNPQSEALKMRCTGMIMDHAFRRKMLRSIKFDNQLCTAAIKIDDISVKLFLASELPGMILKEIIP